MTKKVNKKYYLPASSSRMTLKDMFDIYTKYYPYLATLTVGLASFSTIMMSTSVNVTMPAIMGTFSVDKETVQWVSTGFLGAMTTTILLSAWLIERYGVRRTFIVNMIIFISGCLLAAYSSNIEMLIFSRILQGLAAGFFPPFAQTIIRHVFPLSKLGLAMGLFGMMVTLTPAIGPVFGGIIVDTYEWNYVFFLTIPLSILSIILGYYLLPKRIKNNESSKPPLDWIGLVLLVAFMSVLLVTLSQGQDQGWTKGTSLLGLLIAVTTLVFFIVREYTTKSPLLNISLFKQESFIAANVVTFIFGAGLYASLLTAPLFLQLVQGLDATSAGLVLLPGGLIMAILFPLTGKLSDIFPPHYLVMLGLLLFAISSLLTSQANYFTSIATFTIWILYSRVGLSFIFPAINRASLSTIPQDNVTQASGILNFSRQMGGVFGVNLSILFISQQTHHHEEELLHNLQKNNEETWGIVSKLFEKINQLSANNQLPLDGKPLFSNEVSIQALNMSFQGVFFITAIVFLLSIIPCLFLKK